MSRLQFAAKVPKLYKKLSRSLIKCASVDKMLEHLIPIYPQSCAISRTELSWQERWRGSGEGVAVRSTHSGRCANTRARQTAAHSAADIKPRARSARAACKCACATYAHTQNTGPASGVSQWACCVFAEIRGYLPASRSFFIFDMYFTFIHIYILWFLISWTLPFFRKDFRITLNKKVHAVFRSALKNGRSW